MERTVKFITGIKIKVTRLQEKGRNQFLFVSVCAALPTAKNVNHQIIRDNRRDIANMIATHKIKREYVV